MCPQTDRRIPSEKALEARTLKLVASCVAVINTDLLMVVNVLFGRKTERKTRRRQILDSPAFYIIVFKEACYIIAAAGQVII